MLGLSASLSAATASMRSFVKDNLKLYLDFKQTSHNTLKFPCEGSTAFTKASSHHINFGDVCDIGTGSFTFAGWFNFPDSTSDMFFSKYQSADDRWYFGLNGTDNFFFYAHDGELAATTSGAFSDWSTWVHLAVVCDRGKSFYIYKNGVSQALSSNDPTSSTANLDNTGNFTLARYNATYITQSVSNFAMWERVLSVEEVNSVMRKNYSQLKSVEKTSLVSWWALDTETLSDNLATGWTSSDTEILTTSGANITSAVNSSGHANIHIQPQMVLRYRVYKVSYDYTLVSGGDPNFFTATNGSQDSNVSTSATMASLGSSWYFTAGTATGLSFWRSSDFSITVDNFSIKAVTSADSHGSNTGYYSGATASNTSSHNSATTTTSVYGGNAPVLPRAVDVAREGEAEKIGNGSALFVASNEYYISIPTQFSGGNAYSVSVWAYSSSSANIINQCDTSGNSNIYIQRVATNAYRAYLSSADNSVYKYETTGNGVATLAGWDFVTATFNVASNTILIYVNGILQSTTSASNGTNATTISTNTNLCAIGVRPKTTPDTYWNGNLSQVGIWDVILTQAQIQSVMESTSYATIPASVKSDLVGYWGLDADNSIPVLDFDGSSDYVYFPMSGTYTQFTWAGWFKADVFENTNIWEWGGDANERLGVYTWDNDFHVKLKDQNLTTSAHGLAVNTWFHLACTYDGSTLTLYLNGSSFATASHSSVSTSPSGNLQIGGDTAGGGGYKWDGKVAQFGFYDTTLTSGQILIQYNNGIDNDLSSDSNLVGYWKLDNASTVTDLSGNGNNGTVSGATLANYEVVLDSTDNNNNGDLL